MKEFEDIAQLLLSEAPADEVSNILLEADWAKENKDIQMFYCLMFEQFLDNCSVYMYDGWEEGVVFGAPLIEKYFFVVNCVFPKNFDARGMRRIVGKHEENTCSHKRTKTGTHTVEFRILRSLLDDLEDNNRRDARKEAESLGYVEVPKEEEPAPDDMGADPFGAPADPGGGFGGGMGGPPGGAGGPPGGGGLGNF